MAQAAVDTHSLMRATLGARLLAGARVGAAGGTDGAGVVFDNSYPPTLAQPRFFPLQDRYGNWRVVLVGGRGARLRVVDWHPRLGTAYAA